MSVDFTPSRGEFVKLSPFRFWCQKVLPLVYDDSLSYYELLNKVVDYLNKTMEDVETLNEDTTGLYNAYNQLQGYVNDYFDNLDVQNEINLKLDNMAMDGSLSVLIQPLFDGYKADIDGVMDSMSRTINVLAGRMDEFTELPGGSTSGDAELTDIRVVTDGTAYPTAGDAVRGQVSDLQNDISPIIEYSTLVTNNNLSTGYYYNMSLGNAPERVTNADSYYTQVPIDLSGFKGGTLRIKFENPNTTGSRAFGFVNDNGAVVALWHENDAPYVLKNGVYYVELEIVSSKFMFSYSNARGNIVIQGVTRNAYTKTETDTKLDEIKSQIVISETNDIEFGGTWKEYKYPSAFTGTFKPVKIFTNGTNWRTDYNKEDWKVTSSNAKTYYVNTSGTYLNDGLSREKPTTLYNAISRSSAGDTIIIEDGDYRNDTVTNAAIPSITKSLNIIGEGNVRISKSSIKTPTFDSANNLYTVTQNAMQGVYDPELDIYYTTVRSIDECQNTPNSLYVAGNSIVYINMSYQHDIIAVYNDIMFVIDATTSDVQVYIENIEMMGGGCCFQTSTNSSHSCLVICDNCKFTYNVGVSNSVCKIISGKAIFHNCIARYSQNDGFAYTVSTNGAESGFVEINCKGYSNGYNLTSDSSNGSTAHSGVCGIRINSNYFDNKGGNVTDVQSGTQTINLGCSALNSCATNDGYNSGFACQQAGAKQWLNNCVAFGNFYDFYGVPNTDQIANKCYHKTSNYEYDYSGALIDTKPRELSFINFERKAMLLN